MPARRLKSVVVLGLTLAVAVPGAIWASSVPTGQSRAAQVAREAATMDKAATDADPAKAAVAVSEKFLDALAAGDGATVCAVITARGREAFTSQGGSCERAVLNASRTPQIAQVYQTLAATPLTTDEVLLSKDQARVTVNSDHALLLTRDADGTWRVGGLS